MNLRGWFAVSLCGLAWAFGSQAMAESAWGTMPSAPAGTLAEMFGASMSSSADVWAVGGYNPGQPPTAVLTHPFAQHWDGASWTATPVPRPDVYPTQSVKLTGVSALSPSDAWAVGHVDDINSLAAKTLAFRWNGTAWLRVPTPNPAGDLEGNRLLAVAATSSADAWAVGSAGDASLVLHWDGSAWRRQESPDIGELTAVANHSDNTWAAGGSRVMRFTGDQGWKVLPALPVPQPPGALQLSGLAHSAGRLWAVGTVVREVGEWITFSGYAAHWSKDSGKWAWRYVNAAGQGTWLTGVAAAGNKLWASTYEGHVLRLTPLGSSREVTPTQEPFSLQAIAASAGGERWAVGYRFVDSEIQPALLDAPAIGQGGIRVNTGYGQGSVTWIGPQNGSGETDVYGFFSTGGLPTGRYQIIASGQGCTPGVAKVRVDEGKVREVTALVDC